MFDERVPRGVAQAYRCNRKEFDQGMQRELAGASRLWRAEGLGSEEVKVVGGNRGDIF